MHLCSTAKMVLPFLLLVTFSCSVPLAIADAQELPSDRKPTEADSKTVFPDVPPGHWARSAVENIFCSGIIEGVGERTYEGDRPMTRAEFVVTLARFPTKVLTFLSVPYLGERDMTRSGPSFVESDAQSEKQYLDVPRTHWAYAALRHLSATGLIKGLPNGTLGANAPLTRYDYALALERMVAFINNDSYYFEQLKNPQAVASSWKDTEPVPFTDLSHSHPAYRAVVRLTGVGVFQAKEGSSFQGNKSLTRYEFAASMSRLLNLRGPFYD